MPRMIALHATQRRRGWQRQESHVLLTEAEATRLETALRLARTGKPDLERHVALATVEIDLYGDRALKTTLTVKGYDPKDAH